MEYLCKKLFNGFASIRGDRYKKCIALQESLIVNYDDKVMTIPYDKLLSGFQFHKKTFMSKYNGKPYQLYDFKFIPDEDNMDSKQGRLF